MKATDEQIIAEAHRRWDADVGKQELLSHYIIEVVHENWTPPEPVDPDVLAFEKWRDASRKSLGRGHYDEGFEARAYLAGARMAREREQERANAVVAFAVRVTVGVFNDLDHAKREARKAIDEYSGEV
jgi:hypothetical protein